MVETGTRMGKKVVALITDMEQPLGRKVGNALEVDECLEVLHWAGPADFASSAANFLPGCLCWAGRARTSLKAALSRRK